MGIPVLILGASGSGKSRSMKNFSPEEVCVLNVAGKPFPFKKKLPCVNHATYVKIEKEFKKCEYKKYIIDDSQYLLAFELFSKVKETGYTKYTDIAIHFKNMLTYIIQGMPPDVIVYLLHHTEEGEEGKIKAKTVGKMLDNQLTLEGLFSVVLLCTTEGTKHKFITQSDGTSTAKSPEDMFEDLEIENDLKYVDTVIREYWELGK